MRQSLHPEALAEVVLGMDGLDDFLFETVQPELTAGNVHTLAPDDLAKDIRHHAPVPVRYRRHRPENRCHGHVSVQRLRPGRRGAVPI